MSNNPKIEASVGEVVDYLRLTGQFAPAQCKVVQRKITADAARNSGIEISGDELQKVADTFRITKGLNRADDTESWLKSNDISLEALEKYLETSLLMTKFKDELIKKADKEKYLSTRNELIRDMVFEDWIEEEMK